MKIADLFVDLKLDTGSFAPDLNRALTTAESKATLDVPVKVVTKDLTKDLNTAVKKASPDPIKVPVEVDGQGADRAIGVMDTLGSRASIAAGGIGDLAGALQTNGIISEKTAAIMETTAATIQGVAGVADLAVISTELLKAAKLRDAAASARQTAANLIHAGASKAVTAATYIQAAATRVLNAAMRANPIGIVITAITALIGIFVLLYKKNEAFRNLVNSVWAAIKSAIVGTWNNYIKPALLALWGFIQNTLIPTFKNLWANVVKPIFQRIGQIIGFVWNNVVKPIFAAYKFYITQVLIPAFKFLWNNVIKPIMGFIGTAISNAWNKVIKPIFDKFKSGLGELKKKFEEVRDGIGRAWDGIKEKAKAPIKFVIETVLNKGLIKGFNWLSDKIGGPHIKDIPLPFARGGVLPGYTPGRDVHDFYSPTGGRLALSGGEAIMRPEFTRMVGGKAGVERLNMMARNRTQHFADGGVWGWVKDKASSVMGFLTDPLSYLKKLIPAIPGSSTIRDYAVGAKDKLLGAAVSKIKSLFGGGAAGGTGVGSGAYGWQALWAIVHRLLPGIQLTSAYRPGAITALGNRSLHGMGRAIDVAPPSMAAFNTILRAFPNATQLFYGPADGRTLLNGRPWHMDPITKRNHYDHIHLAMKNGGVFDNGGWLSQGRSLTMNNTGRPEAVLTGAQWEQMERLVRAVESGRSGGAPLIGHAVIRENVDLERYERQRAFRERSTRV